MDYIEKINLQAEEVEEVENLENHILINSEPFSVNKYNGHSEEFLTIGEDYEDEFNQLGKTITNDIGVTCNVLEEVKEARIEANGNPHATLKDRIDSEVNNINASLDTIAINLASVGGDKTGVIKCTSIFQNLANQSKRIFIPEGTFYIDDVAVDGDLCLIGSGVKSLLKCGTIKTRGNVYIDGVNITSTVISTGNPEVVDRKYVLQLDGANNVYYNAIIKNCYFNYVTPSENVLSVLAQHFNNFEFTNNNVKYGGVECKYCNRVRTNNNIFDMDFINNNEVFHFSKDVKDIQVHENTVYKTKFDFVDLYANGTYASIKDNTVIGIQNYAMELKTIYRDIGTGNSSNEIGFINDIIVEGNRFIDCRFNYCFNLNTIDFRTTPISNDITCYSKNIRFINNYIDYSISDTPTGNPYLTATCVPFYVSGGYSLLIENNIVKTSAYKTFYFVVFKADNQTSFYPKIQGNEVIANEIGSNIPILYLAYIQSTSKVINGEIKNNIIRGKMALFLKCDCSNSDVLLDGNITPELDTTLSYDLYQIEFTNSSNANELNVRNMALHQITFLGSAMKLKINNCKVIGARNILESTGLTNEYHIHNCDFSDVSYIRFGGGTIDIINMNDNIFRKQDYILKFTPTTLKKYYSTGNKIPNSLDGSVIINPTSTIIPTKQDDTAKI